MNEPPRAVVRCYPHNIVDPFRWRLDGDNRVPCLQLLKVVTKYPVFHVTEEKLVDPFQQMDALISDQDLHLEKPGSRERFRNLLAIGS